MDCISIYPFISLAYSSYNNIYYIHVFVLHIFLKYWICTGSYFGFINSTKCRNILNIIVIKKIPGTLTCVVLLHVTFCFSVRTSVYFSLFRCLSSLFSLRVMFYSQNPCKYNHASTTTSSLMARSIVFMMTASFPCTLVVLHAEVCGTTDIFSTTSTAFIYSAGVL